MPWIENVSMDAIPKAFHHNCGPNSMLIQIVDPDLEFPIPKHKFKEIHQFKFLDLEADDAGDNKITDQQAEAIVGALKSALDRRMNVVVHCVVGICRSGAVCEVGAMMGFNDTERFRQPNLLVKNKLMRVLGWTYD